jgi:hypothetical protein
MQDLISRLLSTPKKMVEPDLLEKIKCRSLPPRPCCLPHRSIFTAFTSLAGVDAGLDSEVIRPSEDGGQARFARKNRIPQIPMVPPLPHVHISGYYVNTDAVRTCPGVFEA